jgi:ribonuclease HI
VPQINIYTDGAATGNPGPGGYGVLLMYDNIRKELSAGYKLTTNNRMELLAVITALKAIKNKQIPVTLFSDSKYVIDAINLKWVHGWAKKKFANKKNKDLWLQYLALEPQFATLTFKWVKGHADNPYNNRCDQLATMAAALPKAQLLIDEYYEALIANDNNSIEF